MTWENHNTPAEFFGEDYSLASDEISLGISSKEDTLVGTTFQGEADDNVITTATDHDLVVGDRVRVVEGTTLPSGLSAGQDYYVLSVPSATTLTLTESPQSGSVVSLGTDGSADNTLSRMGTLKEVTPVEANATTGDVKQVIYGLIDELYRRYVSVPAADRTAKMVVTRSTSENPDGTFSRTYSFRFTLDPNGFDVSPE